MLFTCQRMQSDEDLVGVEKASSNPLKRDASVVHKHSDEASSKKLKLAAAAQDRGIGAVPSHFMRGASA